MLTSVTNYLFGSSTQPDEQQTDPPVELQTTPADTDKDWLLVDLPDDKSTPAVTEQEEFPVLCDTTNCVLPYTLTRHLQQKHQHCDYDSSSESGTPSGRQTPSTTGSDSPVGTNRYFLHTKIGIHESWILTPPPCFTAGGTSSSQVEMTHMENLLIEHPSMSVYHSHCSQGSTGEESDISESSNENISNFRAKHRLRPRHGKALAQLPPRKPQAVAARAGIVAQIESVKSSQRAKIYKDTRHFNRSNIEKNNKVMKTQACSKRSYTQKTRIQTPRGHGMVQSYQMRH